MTQDEKPKNENQPGLGPAPSESVTPEEIRRKKKEEPPFDKAAERLKQFEEARRPQVPEEEAESKDK